MFKARWTDGSLYDVLDFQVRDASNTLQPVKEAFARGTGGLKRFYTTLAVDYVVGDETWTPLGSTGNYLHSRLLTAVPQGGVAPITYAWSLSIVSGTPSITNTTGGSTTFRHSDAVSATASGNVTLTATDASGATADITKLIATG